LLASKHIQKAIGENIKFLQNFPFYLIGEHIQTAIDENDIFLPDFS